MKGINFKNINFIIGASFKINQYLLNEETKRKERE